MIKPLHDKVVVEEVVTENVSESGLIITGKRTDVKHSKVLSVGDKVTDVKVGDIVIIDWQFASKASYESKTFFVIKEENIIAVVEE
jgi:chaperonin GroES